MVPILFPGTAKTYTTNGIGRLSETIRCLVTEERNGEYECEFDYPITGKFYIQMLSMVEAYARGVRSQMGIIACIHDDLHDIQPFDLYAVSAPMNGIVTFNAHHVSYRLNDEIVEPFDASSIAQCMGALPGKIKGGSEFTFWTDKTATGNFAIDLPENVRAILGGSQGSFLDIYGKGEYQFDKFNVKLYANRGIDSNITIRYGKNLLDITRELDSSDTYNAVAPYWTGQQTYDDGTSEDVRVLLDELVVKDNTYNNSATKARPLDLSTAFDEEPTAAQLRAKAQEYLTDNEPWTPNDNVKVSFVQLWQTTEFENIAALQRLSLCDTVNVYYPELGIITTKQKVIKVVYNVLLERYDEMELGTAASSFADTISDSLMADFYTDLEKAKRDAVNDSMLQAAIQHATELITGGLGGHVVFTLNANGEPEEILIMDTADVNTARNVWRFNQGGLGHSHTGYNGPFSDVALTMDGSINATMITAGTLNANLIKAGIIQDQKQYNYWNMATGEFQLKAYATKTYADNASGNALMDAEDYADTATAQALQSAKSHAEQKANGALSSAKSYTDGKITDYDSNLNQAKVFNKLTSNGTLQGIFMKNNQLYINASYIYSGTLKLGGYNNENGLFEVLDADGNIAILANKDAITFDSEIWYYYTRKLSNQSTNYYTDDIILSGGQNNSEFSSLLAGDYNFYKKRSALDDGELCFYRRILTKNRKVLSTPTIETAGKISAMPNGIYMTSDQGGVYLKGYSASIVIGGNYDFSGDIVPNGTVRFDANVDIKQGNRIKTTYYDSGSASYTWQLYQNYSYDFVVSFTPSNSGSYTSGKAFYFDPNGSFRCDQLYVNGISVTGSKSRIVNTEDYSDRLLYCYETPTPMFGDIGEGSIDETGNSYIFLDPVFAETIVASDQYQVFIQPYGQGECYVKEKHANYFVVSGNPLLKFGWELKAKQRDYDQLRLEKHIKSKEDFYFNDVDYGAIASEYLEDLTKERLET